MDDLEKLSDAELRQIAGLAPGAPLPPPKKLWSASILPLSEDAKGGLQFDSNAGILGGFKRAFTLPGEVMRGEVDMSSPQGVDRAVEMAAVVNPVPTVTRQGGNFAGQPSARMMRPANPPAPSREALYGASESGYENARNMGVDYSADAVRNMAAGLRQSLERDGILEELAPKAFSVLKKLEQPPEGSVAPLAGLEAARRAFRNAGKDFTNPTDQLAADRLIRGLDEFTAGADPRAVVAGPASAASKALAEARANYAAASRSDRLSGDSGRTVQNVVDVRTNAANSGLNLDNTIRGRVGDLLLDQKKLAGFSPEEVAALRQINEGTFARNSLREVGNTLGGGGGIAGPMIGMMAGGQSGSASNALVGALIGLGLPVTGRAARLGANKLTSKALADADELVRKRSPLYEAMKAKAGSEVRSPEVRAALIRALMQAQQEQQQ